jgi:hypothetical protein
MAEALKLMEPKPKAELIWASPRELLNIFQADAIGCHVITVTNDILRKLSLWVFRPIVTGRFGNVTGHFGNVTGDSGRT